MRVGSRQRPLEVRHLQRLGRVVCPLGIVEHGMRQQDEIGLASPDDGVGLLRFGDIPRLLASNIDNRHPRPA